MRFLLDDNVPWSVKEWLESRGVKATKLIEVGLKGANDELIYEFALDNDFKIITLDLDFGYLFLKFQRGTVIVLRPQRAAPDDIVKLLEKTFSIIKNKSGLIVVKPNKIRVISL